MELKVRSWKVFFNINLLCHFEPVITGEKSKLCILQQYIIYLNCLSIRYFAVMQALKFIYYIPLVKSDADL